MWDELLTIGKAYFSIFLLALLIIGIIKLLDKIGERKDEKKRDFLEDLKFLVRLFFVGICLIIICYVNAFYELWTGIFIMLGILASVVWVFQYVDTKYEDYIKKQ